MVLVVTPHVEVVVDVAKDVEAEAAPVVAVVEGVAVVVLIPIQPTTPITEMSVRQIRMIVLMTKIMAMVLWLGVTHLSRA
jgi:hypothetical protein